MAQCCRLGMIRYESNDEQEDHSEFRSVLIVVLLGIRNGEPLSIPSTSLHAIESSETHGSIEVKVRIDMFLNEGVEVEAVHDVTSIHGCEVHVEGGLPDNISTADRLQQMNEKDLPPCRLCWG